MASKKVQNGKIIMFVAALLGLAAILMLLAPGITAKSNLVDKTSSVSGFKVMFGGDGTDFNFMMFLSLIFAVVGILGAVLSFVLKGKLGGLLAIAGFLLAGIFFFCFRAFYPMGVEGGAEGLDVLEKLTGVKFTLGIGAILAGIFSLLAALASAAATFAVKK